MYRSFGAEVTVIEALPRLAPLEDEDISKEVARAFRKRGIANAAGASVQEVKDTGDQRRGDVRRAAGVKTVERRHLSGGGRPRPGDRRARLEAAGISVHEKGFVKVDGQLQTNVEHVWAIGDVAATPLQLAHVSFTEGYAVAERIAGIDVPRSTTSTSRGSRTPRPRSPPSA